MPGAQVKPRTRNGYRGSGWPILILLAAVLCSQPLSAAPAAREHPGQEPADTAPASGPAATGPGSGSAGAGGAGCYSAKVSEPTPFMGIDGEVIVLDDGSEWEVMGAFEYLYAYMPEITICPARGTLIIDEVELDVREKLPR